MKSTGVLRRIDELGRIVIPKEIRKNLKIRDGETLEIYVEDDKILLKKVSLIEDITYISQLCCNSIYEIIKKNLIITDRDKVIATTLPIRKKYIDKEISDNLSNIIYRKEIYIEKYKKEIEIIKDNVEEGKYIISPIVVNGDAIGSVIMLCDTDINEIDEKTTNLISNFLSKQIE